MKYLIRESRLNDYIYQTLNNMFDKDNTYGDYVEDYDFSRNRIVKDNTRFHVWKSDEIDENETAIRWYSKEYFSPSYEAALLQRDKCPIVRIEDKYEDILNNLFNDMWKEPFKKWFTERFGLPVKTIE